LHVRDADPEAEVIPLGQLRDRNFPRLGSDRRGDLKMPSRCGVRGDLPAVRAVVAIRCSASGLGRLPVVQIGDSAVNLETSPQLPAA
jgi:hypothetical protein